MSKQISVEGVHDALGNSEIALIDVRTAGEFSKGSIQGSIHIPLDEIREKIESIVQDKKKIIYLYCLSGARSDMATDILNQLGYTNVFSMTSGLLMWKFKKFALMK